MGDMIMRTYLPIIFVVLVLSAFAVVHAGPRVHAAQDPVPSDYAPGEGNDPVTIVEPALGAEVAGAQGMATTEELSLAVGTGNAAPQESENAGEGEGEGEGEPPITSPTHPDSGVWYFNPNVIIRYDAYRPDAGGYLWLIDQDANMAVDEGGNWRPVSAEREVTYTAPASGKYWFHIIAVDAENNIIAGSQANFDFWVWLEAPAVSSTSHPTGQAVWREYLETKATMGTGESIAWVQATAQAWGYAQRYGYATTVFQDKLWIFGGYWFRGANPPLYLNDALYSDDGALWESQSSEAYCWSGRIGHTVVVFKGNLWLLGGRGEYSNQVYNDVWYSKNGLQWSQATRSAAWPARYGHTTAVFQDKLWVLGGSGLNDVWYSEDGVHWSQATASVAWPARSGHTTAVFQDKLWVLGGSGLNDVWYSEDGVHWSQATASAAWPARRGHTTAVFQDKLWVLGGRSDSDWYNDVWYSKDGVHWSLATASADWSVRYEHATVVFQDKLWVLGGFSDSDYIDVWYWAGLSAIYDYVVDGTPDTVPGPESRHSETGRIEESLCGYAPGQYWLHVKGVDPMGNVSQTSHYAFTIAEAAPAPKVSSATHPDPRQAYPARDVSLAWTAQGETGAPYYWVWDGSPYTVPEAGGADTTAAFTNVAVGRHYLHVRATDACGGLSATPHFSVTIREPVAPQVHILTTSNRNNLIFEWTDPDGFATGTPKFFFVFDQNPGTEPTSQTGHTDSYKRNEFGAPDGVNFFHIRSQDAHGNPSPVAHYAVMVGDALMGMSAPSERLTKTGPVYYVVTYPGATPPVLLTAAMVTLNRTGNADGIVTIENTGDAFEKRVAISSTSGAGTLGITIAAGSATYSNGLSAPTAGPSETFSVDNAPPTITVSAPMPATTRNGPVAYTVQYEGASEIRLQPQDVTLVSDPVAAAGGHIELSSSGWNVTVTVRDIWGQGRLHIEIPAGSAVDDMGNAAGPAIGDPFTVDAAPPTAQLSAELGDWTNGAFTVTAAFSEPVTGFVAAGITVVNGGVSGFTGSAANYEWVVTPNTPGEVRVSINANVCTDAAGNLNLASNTISVGFDPVDPAGSVMIDDDIPFTASLNATLTLTATDAVSGSGGSSVTFMRLSTDGQNWLEWVPFATSKPWTLSSGDGVKTVYAQFRDAAQNVSAPVFDTIVLDTTPPSGSVVIDNNATYAVSPNVMLAISASDAASGGIQMRFHDDSTDWTDWEPLATDKTWTLSNGDGTKIVYAQFKDALGNTSDPVSDTIIRDTTGPTPIVSATAGAWTNAAFPASASFSEPVFNMAPEGVTVVNGGVSDFGGSGTAYHWMVVPAAEGPVHVSISAGVCIDAAGNGNVPSNEITVGYDLTAPTGSVVINEGGPDADNGNVVLHISADDGAGSGVASMRFNNDNLGWSEWEAFAATRTWRLSAGNGDKAVYAELRDAAGNVTRVTAQVNLEQYIPAPNPAGSSLEEAQQMIEDADLTVGTVTEEENRDVPEGQVIRIDPPPGTEVPWGAPVNIVVAKKPSSGCVGARDGGRGAGGADALLLLLAAGGLSIVARRRTH